MSSAELVNSMLRSYLGFVPAAEHPGSAGYRFNKVSPAFGSPLGEAPRLYRICGISWPPVQPCVGNTHSHSIFGHEGLSRGRKPGRVLRSDERYLEFGYTIHNRHYVNPTIHAPRPVRPISRQSLESEAQDLLDTMVSLDLKRAIDAAGSLSPPPLQPSPTDENVSPFSVSSSLPGDDHQPVLVPEPQLRKDRQPLGVLHHDIENGSEVKPFKPPTTRVSKPKSNAKGWDRLRPIAPKRLDIEAASSASSSDVELTHEDDTSEESSPVSFLSEILSSVPVASFDI